MKEKSKSLSALDPEHYLRTYLQIYQMNRAAKQNTPKGNQIGLSLLKKMGWNENAGLGKHENGMKEPVSAILGNNIKMDREGLNEYKNFEEEQGQYCCHLF